MSETARRILIATVAQDPSLGDDARRCEAVLRDLCRNEHRAETKALSMAIQEQVVADLRAGTSGAPMRAFLGRLAGRLHDECGLRGDLARWAVDSWAIALAVISAGGEATAPTAWGQTKGDAREEAQLKARDSNGVERPSDAAELNADGVWQETVEANGVRFELIWVPPGEFWMGARDGEDRSRGDERPRHRVRLTQGFWLGKTPVTQGQWAAVMMTNPSHFTQVGQDGPVESVSWKGCRKFVQGLRRVAGGGWRLPTEAEWEYACRAGSDTAWCCGSDELTQHGWYDANAGGTTHPVGRLKPNASGLYDLHGNVWEWVQDWKGEYSTGGQTDPTGPSSGSSRCIRGGGWNFSAGNCRSASRLGIDPGDRGSDLGVRLARGWRARDEADPKARDSVGVERPSDAAELNADGVWQETIEAKGVPFELIWVPQGKFWMGSRAGESRFGDERPRHRVRLTRGLWMGKTPVTQGQWAAVMGTNPSFFPQVGRDGPVEGVSWDDCQELVQALRRAADSGWRLPTEAEWEYACRAGSETAWGFGSDEGKLTEYGWYGANAGGTTHPVGQLKLNAWGLYDLHGNVWEWVQDWHGEYPAGGQTDPTGPSSGSSRCIRGGGWRNSAGGCRSAFRGSGVAGNRYGNLGVRLARVQP